MSLPLIIYYGKPGLDTQVFQSYMVSSGYQVQVVNNRESARTALKADPCAIVVIATDQDPQEIIQQAEGLRAYAKLDDHIFIISPFESLDLHMSGVNVIPRPYRLSELVRRIQALAPQTRHS
jgi:DNA-binding response OmpR family regulator